MYRTRLVKLDDNNVVVNIAEGDESELANRKPDPSKWRLGYQYVGDNEPTVYPAENFYNNPKIGGRWDSDKQAFIDEQPFSSWTLNDTTHQWDPPVSKPSDSVENGGEMWYAWNDETGRWETN